MCGLKDDADITIPCNSVLHFFPGDLINQKAFLRQSRTWYFALLLMIKEVKSKDQATERQLI